MVKRSLQLIKASSHMNGERSLQLIKASSLEEGSTFKYEEKTLEC
jgi:hypothetical protein